MNNIAISPNIAMYALQNQNVERKIAKKIEVKSSSAPLVEVTDETLLQPLVQPFVAEDTNTTNIADIHAPLDGEVLPPTCDVGGEFGETISM